MRTKTLPGGEIIVCRSSGADKHVCDPMEVPVDDAGRPFFTRCETDSHNNLRVLLSPTSYVTYHANTWVEFRNNESTAPIVQAVKNAS